MGNFVKDITEIKYERKIPQRFTYPFYNLNKLTGGAEVGSLDILFAKTNAGKSELALQFISNWIQNGTKACAMLGEHTFRKAQGLLYKKVSRYDKDNWVQVSYGNDNKGMDTGIVEMFVGENDERKAIDLYRNNLYVYDQKCGFALEDIIKGFEEAYSYGCRVFVLDNMMMLAYDGKKTELLDQADKTETLRQWALRHNAVCYLVAHARKIEADRIRLVETDIYGSSNVSNKATTILSLTRTNTLNPMTSEYKAYKKLLELNYIDLLKCDAIIEVVKEKNGKGAGFVPLKWFEGTKTFVEVYDEEMIAKKKADSSSWNKDKDNTITEPKTVLYDATAPKQASKSFFTSSLEQMDEEVPF